MVDVGFASWPNEKKSPLRASLQPLCFHKVGHAFFSVFIAVERRPPVVFSVVSGSDD